jgi:hypothetical protein
MKSEDKSDCLAGARSIIILGARRDYCTTFMVLEMDLRIEKNITNYWERKTKLYR